MIMWFKGVAIIALIFCLISCIYHIVRLIKLGGPTDLSQKRGNTGSAIFFSYTGAMSPTKKESAYLHLPTYTSGIIYHLGTFLSIILFFVNLLGIAISGPLKIIGAIFLLLSVSCGVGIFIKRVVSKKLRSLSNPDDFFANILVTLFQLLTAITLIFNNYASLYFILSSLLLIYLPAGKLKHAIYFFAARYHLGFFYGWRGVWPPK